MRYLIRFSLHRRFANRMFVLLNVLVFLVIGFLVNLDRFVQPDTAVINAVCLDSSSTEYHDLLKEMLQQRYEVVFSEGKPENDTVLIHFQDEWKLVAQNRLAEEDASFLEEAIRKAVSEKYYREADARSRKYLDEFRKPVIRQQYQHTGNRDNPIWLVYSLIYFVIMSFAGMIANEIVYEKATHTLDLILTAVNPEEHFLARLLTGYLSLAIQAAIALLMGGFWGILRYCDDRFAGLLEFLNTAAGETEQLMQLNITSGEIIICILSVFIGIITVQTLLFFQAAGFSSSEDTGTSQAPFYLLLVIGYYLLLIYGDEEFMKSAAVRILSLIPISSMIFLPCRIAMGIATVTETAVSLTAGFLALLLVTEMFMPQYKMKLMNQRRKRKKLPLLKLSMKKDAGN